LSCAWLCKVPKKKDPARKIRRQHFHKEQAIQICPLQACRE
jgi:hypothetical protein